MCADRAKFHPLTVNSGYSTGFIQAVELNMYMQYRAQANFESIDTYVCTTESSHIESVVSYSKGAGFCGV